MNYAYVTLLYPNKNGICSYLDGALLTALGLRKQNVKFKIICIVTNDVSINDINILKLLYDEIIVVDYISPIKKLNNITITNDLFSKEHYINDDNYSDMAKVFTKLHIFNSKILNYDKILFIDTDLIPLENYDLLFNLNTPAAWLEQNMCDTFFRRTWGVWKNIKHGELIPKKYTQIHKKHGSSINAGLMLIKPDINIYNDIIQTLQKSKNEWSFFKGCFDSQQNLVDYYSYPEQEFLTQYFYKEWHMIDGRYCTWGDDIKYYNWGMHMAGLRYHINNKWINTKTWLYQIPINDGFNMISNEIAYWGIENYPELKSIIYKNLQFYIEGQLYYLKTIKKDSELYEKLNRTQKKIIDIIN